MWGSAVPGSRQACGYCELGVDWSMTVNWGKGGRHKSQGEGGPIPKAGLNTMMLLLGLMLTAVWLQLEVIPYATRGEMAG